MKTLITFFFLITSIFLFGQPSLINDKNEILIKGITTTTEFFEKTRLNNVKIHIYEYNKKIHTYTTHDKGKFEISIPANSYTVIEFEKNNFITKKILFDTKVESQPKNSIPFNLEVTMLKHINGPDYSDLDFPITLVQYDEKLQDFNYVPEYTKLMLKKQEEIMLEQENILFETTEASLKTTP